MVLLPKGEVPNGYDPQQNAVQRAYLAATAHVQTYGDQSYKTMATDELMRIGTEGQSKRLESVSFSVSGFNNAGTDGSVQYRAQVQTYGWQDWVQDGQVAGTQGEAKRLEAVQIRLTGSLAQSYDVYYRAHVQTYGWLGWAKNGESAGSELFAKQLEAIEVVLLPKNSTAPGPETDSFVKPE